MQQVNEVKTNSRIGKTYISNRVELSPTQPIPFENNSTASTYLNDLKYIPFLATKDYKNYDGYAKMLLEARLLSATHNACITTKKDYCAGAGFRSTEKGKLDATFVEWLENLNLKNESATEISKQAFESFFTFGNCPIELVRFTVAGKRYFFVYAHNFLKWRLATPENDIVTAAITSPVFLREDTYRLTDKDDAKQLPLYNPRNSERQNWAKFSDGTERTVIWFKHSMSAFEHYGIPSAVSSMINQILEYKGARYNLDNFDNNMVVAALLAIKGNVSEKEIQSIAKQIIATHTGDGKRGRVMVIGSEEGIEGSDLHNMETTKDGSYNESDGLWSQKIIMANQWDATMMGILSPSTLGKGSGYITKIVERINKDVITPAQKDSYSKVWKNVFRLAKEWMGFNIDENKIEIDNQVDISGLTDIDITAAIQVNEVRRAKSLPEDPTMNGVYMNAAKVSQEKQGGEDVPAK
jgi:hypothetical protein